MKASWWLNESKRSIMFTCEHPFLIVITRENPGNAKMSFKSTLVLKALDNITTVC